MTGIISHDLKAYPVQRLVWKSLWLQVRDSISLVFSNEFSLQVEEKKLMLYAFF